MSIKKTSEVLKFLGGETVSNLHENRVTKIAFKTFLSILLNSSFILGWIKYTMNILVCTNLQF